MLRNTLPALCFISLVACSPEAQDPPVVNVTTPTPNVVVQPPQVTVNQPAPVPAAPAKTIVWTMENSPNAENFVVGYDVATGASFQRIGTGANGGASGNAQGLAVSPDGRRLAAVNFGGKSVSIFAVGTDGQLTRLQNVPSYDKPVSVAFEPSIGGHLYVLSDRVESFATYGAGYDTIPDGSVMLPAGSGPAQVGYIGDGMGYTKLGVSLKGDDNALPSPTGAFVQIDLDGGRATGGTTNVTLPAGANKTPLGFAGLNDGSVILTLAHADKNSLIRKGTVTSTVPSTQAANCWLACNALRQCYTANTGGKSITSLHAADAIHVDREPAVMGLPAGPSDITATDKFVAALANSATTGYLEVYTTAQNGALLPLREIVLPVSTAKANGIAITTAGAN